MTLEIFTDDNDRADAAKALFELTRMHGWQFIERALDLNIQHFEDELRSRRDFDSLHDLYRLQDKLSDLRKFKQLPKLLIEEAQNVLPEENSSEPFDAPPSN